MAYRRSVRNKRKKVKIIELKKKELKYCGYCGKKLIKGKTNELIYLYCKRCKKFFHCEQKFLELNKEFTQD